MNPITSVANHYAKNHIIDSSAIAAVAKHCAVLLSASDYKAALDGNKHAHQVS